MEIILGSSSPVRAKILTEAGIPFSVMKPNIDEKAFGRDIKSADHLVIKLSLAKAEAILARKPAPGLLITSDQVVVSNEEILEKPDYPAEARMRLMSYHEYAPTTHTAVAVTDIKTRRQYYKVDTATVIFNQINKKAINKAIERGTIMNCCGAFDIDDPDLVPYIECINGERDSVLGLPLKIVRELAAKLGCTL